jgi:hypothetical protein
LLAAALLLTVTAWESASAQPAQPKPKRVIATTSAPGDTQIVTDPSTAMASREIEGLRQALPGNESTWFVLVLQDKSSDGSVLTKNRKLTLVQGRTTAAYAVICFYGDGKRAQKKFQYFAFPDLAQAQACYRNVRQYNWQAGYR